LCQLTLKEFFQSQTNNAQFARKVMQPIDNQHKNISKIDYFE